MRIALALILLCALLLTSGAVWAGKYQLAYWRELGAYENDNVYNYGYHDVWVNVWNEDGAPRPGIHIFNTGSFDFGVTDSGGTCHLWLWSSASDFYCKDGSELYEITPIFDERRAPHYGHYSWEVGFVYRPSTSPTGAFDTSWDGELNSTNGDVCGVDAPATRSLAFYSTKPTEACSDNWGDSASATEHGQTFIAKGDRIVAAKAFVIGDRSYRAEIRSGGPTGPVVGTAVTAPSGPYTNTLAKWSFNSAPVTPDSVYYLRITMPDGSPFRVRYVYADNYAGGTRHENGSPASGELMGAVVMAWTGGARIAGQVRAITGAPISGATVATSTGGYSTQTDADGNYTLYNVAAGTYTVTASKWGYSDQTLLSRVVTGGGTTTVNFNSLKALTNLLTNPRFQNELDGWTKYNTFDVYDPGEWAVPNPWGFNYAGNVISGSGYVNGTLKQQVSGIASGSEYRLTAYLLTDSFSGDRDIEYPTNNKSRIGIDPTGSGIKGAGTIVWSPWTYSHNAWTGVTVKAPAQGAYTQMTVWLDYQIGQTRFWNKAAFCDITFALDDPVVVVDTEPTASDVTDTLATISWHTNLSSDSRVDYGPTTSYGQNVAISESVTNHAVTLTGLQPNTLYHCKVTSSKTGLTPGTSDDFTFTTETAYTNLPHVSGLAALADGAPVVLANQLVSGGVDQLGEMFYIQATSGIGGIRVNCPDVSVHEGDRRDVYGVIATRDGERCIDATHAFLKSSGNAVPDPYGVRTDCTGSAATRGLLVRTWGRVASPVGSDYFDLQGTDGGVVRVYCGALTKPTPDAMVAVTGCRGADGTGPVVRVRKQVDIQTF